MPPRVTALRRLAAPVMGLATVFAVLGIAPTAAFANAPLCSDYQQCSQSGMSDHGYGAVYGESHWGMYGGHNCTNYIAYMLGDHGVREPDYRLGNAAEWGPAAASAGVPVDGAAAVGAVAWWSSGAGGLSWAGHVAWVEKVTPDAITVSEDNYPYGPYDWRVIPVGSSGWPSGFIHFSVPAAPDGADQPSIATTAAGGTAVATVRTDRSLALYSRSSPRSAWTETTVAPAGSALSAPALALGAGGLAEIAVRGPRGALMVYGRSTAGSAWTLEQVSAPGAVSGAPAAVLTTLGGLEVAVAGPGGTLEVFTGAPYAAGRHARRWTTTTLAGPGSVLSRPAMTRRFDGTTQIAVVGPGHSLVLHTGLTNGLWSIQTVAGAGAAWADPSLAVGPGGALEVATVGTDHAARVWVDQVALQSGLRTGPGTRAAVTLAPAARWTAEQLSAPGTADVGASLLPGPGTTVSVALVDRLGAGRLAVSVGSPVRQVSLSPAAPAATSAGQVEIALITPAGRLQLLTRQRSGAVSSQVVDPVG